MSKHFGNIPKALYVIWLSTALLLVSSTIQAKTTVIAMYGDSTMQGWTKQTGVATVTTKNAPADLGAMLQATGYDAVVENHGVFGTTSSDLVNGTNGVPRPWAQEMAASDADIVIVNDGLNDAVAWVNGAESQATIINNWLYIISVAKAAGKKIYIETPSPRIDTAAYSNQAWAVVLTEVYMVLTGMVPNIGWIDQYSAITNNMPNWKSHLPDGIHPDDTMYAFKACVELGVLSPLLTLAHDE